MHSLPDIALGLPELPKLRAVRRDGSEVERTVVLQIGVWAAVEGTTLGGDPACGVMHAPSGMGLLAHALTSDQAISLVRWLQSDWRDFAADLAFGDELPEFRPLIDAVLAWLRAEGLR